MEVGEKTRLLSRVDLLQPLSREELEKLAQRITVVRFERGRKVYTPAYQGGALFFVLLQGRVRIYKRAKGRGEITLALVRAG